MGKLNSSGLMRSNEAHAEKIKTIQLYDLSPGHYQEMIRRIDSFTHADVAAISEQYFQEDSFLQVAVG